MRLTRSTYCLAALCLAPAAWATTTFDTPESVTVDSALDDVVVSNGAQVTFAPGGSATGVAAAFPDVSSPGVTLEADSGLTVAGGSIVGGQRLGDGGFAGNGIQGFGASDSTLLITDGTITGGTTTNSGFSGNAVQLDGADITITGGTLAGGSKTSGGFGGEALNVTNSTVNISGGSFIGVETTALNFFQTGGTISGGTFTTNDQRQTLVVNSLNSVTTTLDLTGGLWEDGSTLAVGGLNTTVNVFGTDLQINNNILTGTLLDGNDINFTLNLFSDGTINLIPEPTSFALLTLGTLALTSRRRTAPVGWSNDLPSGQIEQTELDGVLQNWGNTSAPEFGNRSVPEPSTFAMLSLAAATLRRCRHAV